MTVRVFPLPLSEYFFKAKVDTGDKHIGVYSLRRTDEFMIAAIKWDSINYPLVLNVGKVAGYLKSIEDRQNGFFEIYSYLDRPLGISFDFRDNEVTLTCFCRVVIGEPLVLSLEQLDNHRRHVVEMTEYLTRASNNTEYKEVN